MTKEVGTGTVTEQIDGLIANVIQKTELLIKMWTPEPWDNADNLKGKLRHIDSSNDGKIFAKNLSQKLEKIKSIQESMATITSFENISK